MKLCILDNDEIDPALVPTYGNYAAMMERVLRNAGATHWSVVRFSTPLGEYPESFADYDAVLLTGSKADSFSDEPWVVELRRRVTELLETETKLVGVCFGHQLIALCMGAKVGRAPQGWVTGRNTYNWHASELLPEDERESFALLASHQDQVLELPAGTTLVASNDRCPIAAFAKGKEVLCIQPHPEFVEDYSAYLLNKRRALLGNDHYVASMESLAQGHEGTEFARVMVAFIEGRFATAD
ncbi:MAG: amidotransferase [Curvibacter sp.]|nr:MAG: amidotransferase [Curvibacter sp.]